MSQTSNPVNLDTVLRRGFTRTVSGGSAEEALDALLQTQPADAGSAGAGEPPSPLDATRLLFRDKLIPVFEELKAKYQSRGVGLSLTADDLLQGGRGVRIVIEYGGAGLRLDGTVMSNAIAFQQTSYSQQDPAGLAASGPSLRTRDLTAETFRGFVCERIGGLVEFVASRRR